ncbi:MAG: amidohydrolase family protein [Deltaproteobacteria bacterium]|nr:amidohydrolase family protein [Deltaproteobacteria bacterium]
MGTVIFPMETIVCATRNNAQILDLHKDLGTLKAGKLIDLLVVDGDPFRRWPFISTVSIWNGD